MFHWLYRFADGVRQRARRHSWDATRALGRDGEDLAHRYLQQQGMLVVARNWKTRSGSAEVDLIARDGDSLVFIEVKSRSNTEYGSPERQIDPVKERKIVQAAREYTRRLDWNWEMVRFDIVSVVFDSVPRIAHVRDAFHATSGI